jgi:two-component system sensor histidine kinase UhpB
MMTAAAPARNGGRHPLCARAAAGRIHGGSVADVAVTAFRANPRRLRWRLSPTSLFWRVFLVNATLVTVASILLAVTPLTVSNPATGHQLMLLGGGLFVLLVANVVLLRVSLRPLERLTRLMGRIDLLKPGERLEVEGARELNVVSAAFNEMLERLEGERQLSSRRSVGREEDARRQLAAELHDQVGQGLTALLLQLKSALAHAPLGLRGELVEAQAIARHNLDEVRRIARRLRPTVLDDLGLAYALLSLADAAEEQTDAHVVRRIELDVPRLAEEVELAIYRIAQEALTNAIRHSAAGRIELELAVDGDGVRLGVHDNGRGMIYAADVEGGGIRGIRERAIAANADLSISSRAGGGTTVTARVGGEP